MTASVVHQARAMLDLLNRYNWRALAVVTSTQTCSRVLTPDRSQPVSVVSVGLSRSQSVSVGVSRSLSVSVNLSRFQSVSVGLYLSRSPSVSVGLGRSQSLSVGLSQSQSASVSRPNVRTRCRGRNAGLDFDIAVRVSYSAGLEVKFCLGLISSVSVSVSTAQCRSFSITGD